jgi:hypothetical protein
MPKPLFAIPNSDYALTVTIPCNVVDSASYDVVVAFGVLRTLCIPDSYASAHIARCYVESTGAEPCNCSLCGMLCVLLRDLRMIN